MGLWAVMFNHSFREIGGTRKSSILAGLGKPWPREPLTQPRFHCQAGSRTPAARQSWWHVLAFLADPSVHLWLPFLGLRDQYPVHHRARANETVENRT